MHKMMRKCKKWISIVLTTLMLFSLVSPQLAAKAASTDPVTLAKWDFSKGQNLTTTDGIAVNLDKTMSIAGATMTGYAGGPTTGISVPTSTTWTTANPSYWQVSLSTKGYQSITLSSKQRGSNTGPRDFSLQYSLDGSNFVNVPNGAITVANNWTSGVLTNVSLPSDVADKDLIYVRWLKNSNASNNGGTVAAAGTNQISDVVLMGVSTGAPTLEKTATPDATKITYASYPTVTGTAGAVAGNATVNLYYDDNSLAASTTAAADGSFTATIANPQSKAAIYVTAQENGKDPSDKATVNYSGTVVTKTAAPLASKITYSSYTTVTGAAGAVANNASVKIYDESNNLLGSTTAGDDGSFTVTITNPQSKSLINVTAQETGKDPSDKVAINYSGPASGAQPGDVVFSQIYTNGGNSGTFYNTKFFELYNNTNKDIDLSSWSIVYTSAGGTAFSAGKALSGTIKAHGYFLITGAKGATGANLPVVADKDLSTLSPSGSGGGTLALAKTTSQLSGLNDPNLIDLVSYTNGTTTFSNSLYWGSRISDSGIGGGTIERKTNIGTDPRSAFGMINNWFTKDPSKDFVLNKVLFGSAQDEIVVHNSKYMVAPDGSKITFTRDNGTDTITGLAGGVPASATVKVYYESDGELTTPQSVTAGADGSFTFSAQDNNQYTTIYLTHTDTTQTTPRESIYTRVNLSGTNTAVTPISDLRSNDENGFAINTGYTTTIEGVATTDNTPTGNLKTNFFVQDSPTSGINVVNNLDPSVAVKAGNKYSITGQVVFNAGMTQFIPSSIRDLGADTAPTANAIGISSVGEGYEGTLVTFTGKVTNIPTNGPDYDITVSNDAGNMAIVRLQGSASAVDLGSTYTFTGIVNQYKKANPYTSGFFLLPRSTSDIKGQLSLTHTPITKAYIGLDANFKAYAKNATSVKLYYKGESDPSYTSIDMTTADGHNYNGKILKDAVPQGKFFYYIEAKNSDETKSVGTADNPNPVVVTEDTDGPDYANLAPVPGDSNELRYPTISADLIDPHGVDTHSVTISIDGQDYTSAAVITDTNVKLALTIDQSLTEGDHTVVVTAKDTLGNSSSKTWTFNVAHRFTGGNHYRGTTHNHTNISHDAAGTPEEALQAAKKYHYDFFAFSDHSHDIDSSLAGKDTVDHNGMKERTGGPQWQLTKDLAKQYTEDGKFVVFPAFEMTSTTWGHSNVFGTQNFIDRVVDGGAYQNLQKYYSWAITYDNIVAQFNHPAMSANAFDNFIPYNKKVDQLFTLLEVGNGSGAYSYANAEDKFYSALDLGWHVAPTYGEDNHDGTWGQTKKRTVIVAKDLTQDSLLDSMKNMRVYMSEDPNFTLDVSASGFYMGSTVDTNTLDFSIKGSDPVLEKASDPDYSYIKTASNDAIAKVELITNKGTVLQTYTPTDDSTSLDWHPDRITVAGGQQWFVVKVTQKDGDRIYSAPIWSPAKELSVNVSDVSTSDGAIVGGVSANLTAGISNQGSVDVSKITANFYYDSVDANHLIGTSSVDSLPANTSGNASVVWQNPVAGTHNIIVTLTAGDGHDLGDNKFSQSFVIKAPLGKTVMIDGTHSNENTKEDTGTYRDNLKLFTTLMKQQGYTVVDNTTPLSDQLLSNVAVLYITHPATAYTADEIAAINKFVHNGGSLLMTEKSNFGGSNQNENAILSGVGSSIQVNNDGVFDETTDGNFWSTPLTSNFSVRLHPAPINTLLDFVPTIEYYSGASLAGIDGSGNKVPLTNSDKVTVLVRGNESTFQDTTTIKSDSVQYNVKTSNGKNGPALTDVTGGSAIPMIASEDLGKGRIIVSGMNIFNDKQMDQTYNAKGNDPFAVNAVNWLSHLEPKVLSIGDARKLTEGTNTVVEGTVTATSFFDAAYIQDDTGGIMAFNDVPAGSLKVGDKIRVYGHIKIFENNFELEFGSFAASIVKLGSGTPIEPKLVTTKDANAEENQGLLVKVKGTVVSKYDDNSYVIDDGTGPTLVFTDGYVVNQSGPVPVLKAGDTLEAVGMAGKFSEGNRIRVRDTKELVGTIVSAPVVTGVDNNGVYNHDVTITFEKGTAVLNGQAFTSGTTVTDEGTYALVVTDQYGNATTVNFIIDKTNPVVSGVTDNGIYNQDVTISFNKGTAALDGMDFTSGTAVTEEGSHALVVTDQAGNVTTVHFTIDKTAPVVSGVDNNGHYKHDVTVTFDDGTATLNGIAFTSGSVVSDDGTYNLVVTDQAGNATTIVFTIDKTAPVVTGVDNNGLYNKDVTISFNEGTAKLDGNDFTSGTSVTDEGSHTLVVTDAVGNVTTVTFAIDKTAPVVTGVKDGYYNHEVTITFEGGTATLNGEAFTSGTTVSDEGSYTLAVTDEAGNSTVVNFTIDKTVPSVTGVADGSYYNQDVTITFDKGSATLNDADFTSGTVVSAEGTYTLVVTDQAGNTTTVHFTIDKTAPTVDGVTNNGFYNQDVTLSFNELGGWLDGKAVATGTVVSDEGTHTLVVTDAAENTTTVTFTIDKTAPVVSGVDNNGLYNHDVTVSFTEGTATLDNKDFTSGTKVTAEGSHTLVVTDEAGNATTVKFTIDKTAPNVTGVTNNGLYNKDVTITFTEGTATLDGKTFTSGTKVSSAGAHTLVVTDQAGNVTTIKFTIDKTAPVVSGVSNGGYYNKDVTIKFTEGKATLNGKTFTSGTVVKTEGAYTLVVTDAAGNVTTVKFTIDKTAPIVSGVSNNGLYNHDVTIKFNEGTATLNGKVVASGTVVKAAGAYKLEVTDKAGNKTTIYFIIDKTAPSAPKVDNVTAASTKVTGKAEAGSTVTVKVGSKTIGTAVADRYGKFTVKIAKQKAGTNLYVSAKDKAGNVSKSTKVTVKK